jgi:sugar lactone lactonase YvrE
VPLDNTELRTVASGLAFPESPRWHRGEFWFSDFHARTINRVDASGERYVEVELPLDLPSGLGWTPDGDLLAVSMLDRRLVRWDGKRLELWADLLSIAEYHLNDMLVTPQGTAYVGNFGFDVFIDAPFRTSSLVMVDPTGGAAAVARGLRGANGMELTPDGRTLIVTESFGACLTAFDVADDGTLSGRRTWAQLPAGLVPGSVSLDAQGHAWVP